MDLAFAWETGADFSSASSDFKSLGAFFCNFVTSPGSSAGVAHGQPRGRVPDLVGSRLPSPYHFRARIQSFQAVAAPFPGNSFLPSASRAAIPATAAWELRNQPKSKPLCRSPSAGGLYVISIGYKTFKTGAFISRVVVLQTQRGIPRLPPRIGKALRYFKKHPSMDFVFQKENRRRPLRIASKATCPAKRSPTALPSATRATSVRTGNSRRRSVMAGFARDRGDRPAPAQEIVAYLFPSRLASAFTARRALRSVAVDAVGDVGDYRSSGASEWASAPIRRRAKGSRAWSQGLEGVAK